MPGVGSWPVPGREVMAEEVKGRATEGQISFPQKNALTPTLGLCLRSPFSGLCPGRSCLVTLPHMARPHGAPHNLFLLVVAASGNLPESLTSRVLSIRPCDLGAALALRVVGAPEQPGLRPAVLETYHPCPSSAHRLLPSILEMLGLCCYLATSLATHIMG